ncbi:hypothetical protein H9Y04_01925 [Streptomyces sp. TRM66268-LWL]|uniref:Immunity protein 35 domain-containing protein n=1 Tax=Streptomyces polyasparticus TaxID=2767826 RepID=A0ABR7S9M6_9ACTN|nr:hypothetical protein [Streptomyces polyasparticus]MBC9711327.1 hypothetical protein [Streptomyces polyasparticus]
MTIEDVARQLPETAVLREHCRSLAMLDAALSPEWEWRYHSFDHRWSETEVMASMRNGSGDEYAIVFSPAGAYVRGFAHESPMSPYVEDGPWSGVLDEVPDVFRSCVEEPAFCDEQGVPVVTACTWRQAGADRWATGTIDFPEEPREDPDGAQYLFRLLTDRSPEAFQRWAQDYYEVEIGLDAVRHILGSRPLTESVVNALNPEITLAELADDIAEIGYPSG